tara:strand:- start:3629 stop:3976 length:348 start_codon:yes stop_codon:yes gene_type:complete
MPHIVGVVVSRVLGNRVAGTVCVLALRIIQRYAMDNVSTQHQTAFTVGLATTHVLQEKAVFLQRASPPGFNTLLFGDQPILLLERVYRKLLLTEIAMLLFLGHFQRGQNSEVLNS